MPSEPATSPTSAPFSIVTVTHNSGETTLEMVESLPSNVELVLVDNASSDGMASRVAAIRPSAIICELRSNKGFGAGCNVGAHTASHEVVIFLNPDCRPRPRALEALARAAAQEPGSVFGPALLDEHGSPRHNLRRRSIPAHEVVELLPSARRWAPQALRRDVPKHDPRYRVGGPADYLQGACLAVHRNTFLSVGGFDEDFFLYSEEETLCEAVIAMGGRCVYVPEAIIEHIGGTSTAQVSSFALRHLYRSRAIFYRKRYGSVSAGASILAIGTAAALQILIRPLMVLAHRGGARRGGIRPGDVIIGLAQGALAQISRR